MTIVIKLTPDMGRGVFSTTSIRKGEVITTCEILELSQLDTITVNTTDLKWYTFKLDMNRDCLVLGHGEIFNHSAQASVSYKLVQVSSEHGKRLVMEFRALQDIPANAQLFIDYTADEDVNAADYTVNMISTISA